MDRTAPLMTNSDYPLLSALTSTAESDAEAAWKAKKAHLFCRATDTPFCSPIPYSVDDPNELADLEEDANLTIEELRKKYASRGNDDEESFEDEEDDESYEQEEDSEDDEIDEADDIPEGTHFSIAFVVSKHFPPSTNSQ